MNAIQSMDAQQSAGLFKFEATEKCSASSEEEFVLAGDEGALMELEASYDDLQKSTTDRKRKLEEKSDDSDDSDDYDSSDEYGSVNQEESDESEEETEAADNSDSDGNEYLMSAMDADASFTSQTEKNDLLPKIRRYIKSVNDSEGYECKYFPGAILGVTTVAPRKSVIRHRDRYPEGYNRIMYLSTLALKQYNEKESTMFIVENVIDVNVMMSMWCGYLITFTATESERTQTFQAHVNCNCIEGTIMVVSCNIKPGSVPTTKTTRQGFECDFAEDEKTDPLTEILRLSSHSDEELLVKIGKVDLPAKEKNILLKKVRKYFKSVLDSKGFKCSYYPGHIPGVTYLKPRYKIVDLTNNLGECYEHLELMCILGLDFYFKQKGEPEQDYKVVVLNYATMWKESSCSYFYYVTFEATKWDFDEYGIRNLNPHEKFQVKAHDIVRDVQVLLVNKLED